MARTTPAAQVNAPPDRLWRVRVRDIWSYLWTQPPSFWLICFYLFMEYVRPQSVWPSIDVLPWAALAIWGALVAVIVESKVLKLPTVLSPLYMGFIVILLLSSLTAVRPQDSWAKIDLPLSWFLIYTLIVTIINTERRFFIFMLSFLLYSAKMSQHGARTWASVGFGFQSWGATGAPGWFHNSGEFGIQMCVFFPLAIAFIVGLRKYWPNWKVALFALMPVTAVMSMVASSSRGALVGGAAVLAWMIVRSKYRIRGLIYGAVAVWVVIAVLPEEQKARFETAGEDDTSVARTVRWTNGVEIANQYPVLGIGYNNWLSYHRERYGGGLPHNIFIDAWAEMGYLGLFSFVSLILGTFYVNWGTRRIARMMGEHGRFLYQMGWGLDGALIGFMASGFFVSVLHYPYFWINLAMVASLRVATERKVRALQRSAPPRSPAPQPGRVTQPAPAYLSAGRSTT